MADQDIINEETVSNQTKITTYDKYLNDIVRDMLDNFYKFNLSYATIGFSDDGPIILDQNLLIELMINYGYPIEAIWKFIDRIHEVDDYEYIIMINTRNIDIYQYVKKTTDSTSLRKIERFQKYKEKMIYS